MKLSERWIREWVDPPVDSAALSEQLTLLGLEVDETTSAHPGFSDVVVARIEEIAQHPDADRLRVCTVNDGSEESLQVVCGAPNARKGLTTALARVGGKLPDGTKLKKAKLRGVVSMGMLCSASELGLSEEHAGIMELADDATPGTSLVEHFDLDDTVITIELTPDRGDCLSIRGVARDVAARNSMSLKCKVQTPIEPASEARQGVVVQADSACSRYAGRVIEGVDLTRASPLWMTERLRRSGIRSINPAVDVTNYVMLERGQPMHAFDKSTLQGDIVVRLATAGERLILLDGRDVELDNSTSVIADDSGAIGIAGIMGGLSTAVQTTTTEVYLEAAYFHADDILGRPRLYGLHTESSQRFERGVDPEGQRDAIEYATTLLLQICGGAAGLLEDHIDGSRLPKAAPITVRSSRMRRVLGMSVPNDEVEQLFRNLEVTCAEAGDGWQLTAPSHRPDLKIEEDFIAEVGRMYGYDRLPRTLPTHQPAIGLRPESAVSVLEIKQRLAARGYQEVVTLSFVDQQQQQLLRPDLKALALANPISSELGVMRTTLIGGLLDVMRRNQSRQQGAVRLFESGLRFVPTASCEGSTDAVETLDKAIAVTHGGEQQVDESLFQQSMLAGLVSGPLDSENWNAGDAEANFFAIKADIEVLLARANAVNVSFGSSDLEMLHPGQRATVFADGVAAGYVGGLHPGLQKSLDLSAPAFVFELSLHALTVSRVPAPEPVSRLPQVRRDLALLVDDDVSWQDIYSVVMTNGPAELKRAFVFDVYRGKNLEKGKKSMALGLILQDFSRTLKDKEVDVAVARIVAALTEAHGAVLRV